MGLLCIASANDARTVQTKELIGMRTTRDRVVRLLRSRGQHDLAATACCCLPRSVDTRRDAIRLRELGLSEATLRSECRDD